MTNIARKSAKSRGILLGVALLGVSLLSAVQPASAARGREVRRDVNRDGVYDHKDAFILGQRRQGVRNNRRVQRDVNRDGIYDHKDAFILGQRRNR